MTGEGPEREALTSVRAFPSRFGSARCNPFGEHESRHHYASSMACRSPVLALSGSTISRPHGPSANRSKPNPHNDMTLFSKIIAGEIPSYRCAEDERFYAFLDINPLAQGHTLVVPKHEVDYLFDLPDEELAAMVVFTKRVARAIGKAFPCRKVGMAVLGLEVNHAHIHLVPLHSEGDLDFSKPKLQFTPEQQAETAARILTAFETQE